jgi:Kef-type K+ transport system membrane component KefB
MSADILSTLEFQMTLLLFIALLGYLISYRINQSAVVGIIFAGIIIGPSLLGLITYTDFIASLATLGAIILLFTVGLHFQLSDIFKLKYLFIALCGVIIPWLAGFYTALLFHYELRTSIFVGTTLTATSIAITANLLKEMNLLQTKVAQAIIGAAVVDDILSLIALSISEGVVSNNISFLNILLIIVKVFAFIAVAIIVGRFGITRLMNIIQKTRFYRIFPETMFIFAIMVAFLYAMFANLVGLSAIIGSFIAGIVIGESKVDEARTFREGAKYLEIIFASIFFISLGILMDFHELDWNVGWFIGVLSIVAILSKLIGCALPYLTVEKNIRSAFGVGVGMIPRGEVAMIVALIGLNQNLIPQDVYATLVLMSLITTIVAPLMLRNLVFRKKHFGVR